MRAESLVPAELVSTSSVCMSEAEFEASSVVGVNSHYTGLRPSLPKVQLGFQASLQRATGIPIPV